MTADEAKREQDRIAAHYNLAWWYGTDCEKCCGVFPKFMVSGGMDSKCWYECQVCGKRTKPEIMPWIAREAWNSGKVQVEGVQMSMF